MLILKISPCDIGQTIDRVVKRVYNKVRDSYHEQEVFFLRFAALSDPHWEQIVSSCEHHVWKPPKFLRNKENWARPPSGKDPMMLLIAGDAGVTASTGVATPAWQQDLSRISGLQTLICCGDLDREHVEKSPAVEYAGGVVYPCFGARNVTYLRSGDVFELYGHTLFSFGDARDIGTENILEALPGDPDEDTTMRAYRNLKRHCWKIDIVLTHEAPWRMLCRRFSDARQTPMSSFLQEITNKLDWGRWIFGHHHQFLERIEETSGIFMSPYHRIINIQ